MRSKKSLFASLLQLARAVFAGFARSKKLFRQPSGYSGDLSGDVCSLARVESGSSALISALIVCSAVACGSELLREGLERFRSESRFVELL
jgi:hypothetical protein